MNMNKNAVIGIVVAVVLVVVVGAFFIFRGDKAFDVPGLDRDVGELDSISADLDAFSKDNVALEELNQTFSDILDETSGISAVEALDESSIAQESSQADFGQTLNAFAADDAALSELDQALGEVSQ
ncbi:MAG: hypothetical protein Q8Q94_00450 [bacterium]|nr:hypothetical protein [bacterium]